MNTHKLKSICTLILAILCFGTIANAQDLNQYTSETFIKGKDTMNYRVLLPENFDSTKTYPVLFFLHGSGERGNDNQAQLINGARVFLKRAYRKDFPSIVIFPQCPKDGWWSNTQIVADSTGKRQFIFQKGGKPSPAMHALLALVGKYTKKHFVNEKQIYVGGLSMGGMGTYELLRRKPKMFAAAFAICGGDDVENVSRYKKIPLWIFHGAKDTVVDPQFSKNIADKLTRVGKEVKYTVYAAAEHNSWDAALAEPELFPWLFSHIKN